MTLWLILLLVWTAGIPTAFFALAGLAAWLRREPRALPATPSAVLPRRHGARSRIAGGRSQIALHRRRG